MNDKQSGSDEQQPQGGRRVSSDEIDGLPARTPPPPKIPNRRP
ncbi:hypothetical protein AB0L00_39265 [Actinoallomurus sp. NPDC052308]